MNQHKTPLSVANEIFRDVSCIFLIPQIFTQDLLKKYFQGEVKKTNKIVLEFCILFEE